MGTSTTELFTTDAAWDSRTTRAYLREYYAHIGPENAALLQFHAHVYRRYTAGGVLLEFGGGPTIYPLISAAPVVDAIHFAEHSPANRREIQRWLERTPDAYDWSPFVAHALCRERAARARIDATEIAGRQELLRSRITRILPCDAFSSQPLGRACQGAYDIVSMNFVAESICAERAQWRTVMATVGALVKPGGLLVMTALLGATHYTIERITYPAAHLSLADVRCTLEKLGFTERFLYAIPAETALIRPDAVPSANHGYAGIALYAGQRLPTTAADTPAGW